MAQKIVLNRKDSTAEVRPHPVDKVRIKRAMALFDVSESFLRHAIMTGIIPHYKLGGATFLSIKEIEQHIEAGRR